MFSLLRHGGERHPDGRLVIGHNSDVLNFTREHWEWGLSEATFTVPDPMSGAPLYRSMRSNDADVENTIAFHLRQGFGRRGTRRRFSIEQWGRVFPKAAEILEANADKMAALIMACVPKSVDQAMGEVTLTVRFLRGFSENDVRALQRGVMIPGTMPGELAMTTWEPYGLTSAIFPFNFPLEIPALQMVGALACGNAIILKPSELGGIVLNAFVEILLQAGCPTDVFSVIHGIGREVGSIATDPRLRMVLFTGSHATMERLYGAGARRVKGETSGVNPRIMLPFNGDSRVLAAQVVATEGDGYNLMGQKCSAMRLCFPHQSWIDAGFLEQIRDRAAQRRFDNLTMGPVLTWSTSRLNERVADLCDRIPGAEFLWGGMQQGPVGWDYTPPTEHTKLFDYGFVPPTNVQVPLKVLSNPQAAKLLQTEVFGPIFVTIPWETDADLQLILGFLDTVEQRLTAAVVGEGSKAMEVAALLTNGTTTVGWNAVTTGAPEWRRFGPTGDPRDCCIGGHSDFVREVWAQPRDTTLRPLPPA